jgi:quercetin dioxygenase-like cupin family protein
LMRRLLSGEAAERVATGLIVRAVKPATSPARPASVTAAVATRSGATSLAAIAPDAVEAPGVTVRHLKSVEDVSLKVLDVEPGGSTPFHTHAHAHEGVIISGTGELRLDGRTEPLRPGDVFSVNPTEAHAIASAGDEPLRFVCMDCFIDQP